MKSYSFRAFPTIPRMHLNSLKILILTLLKFQWQHYLISNHSSTIVTLSITKPSWCTFTHQWPPNDTKCVAFGVEWIFKSKMAHFLQPNVGPYFLMLHSWALPSLIAKFLSFSLYLFNNWVSIGKKFKGVHEFLMFFLFFPFKGMFCKTLNTKVDGHMYIHKTMILNVAREHIPIFSCLF